MWVYPANRPQPGTEPDNAKPEPHSASRVAAELRFSDGTRAKHARPEAGRGGQTAAPRAGTAAQNTIVFPGGGAQLPANGPAATPNTAAVPAHSRAAAAAPRSQSAISNSKAGLPFALLYAAGLLLGGALYGWCGQKELLFLQTYLELLKNTYLTAPPFRLFVMLFVCAAVAVTLALIFSLCAFGVPLLFLLVTVSGIGSGLAAAGLFAQNSWKGILLYALLMGVYNAFVGYCICILSRSGAAVAMGLFASVLNSRRSTCAPGDRQIARLLRCYGCLLMLLAPLCGLCAAFSGFAGKILPI